MTQYTLPPLPYDYSALEPVLSAEIMHLHHEKHHAAYVTNLNIALQKHAEAEQRRDLDTQISLQPAIRFNGGGHINHTLFWESLAPTSQGGGELPSGSFAKALEARFGSLQQFIDLFNGKTGAIQGSGWGWLCWCKDAKHFSLVTCANQDPLFATTSRIPLLGIDVWEHAYYPQYKNARAEYLKNIWKVINWKTVATRFDRATHSSCCGCH